jgi:short-subunit dehydrogenase
MNQEWVLILGANSDMAKAAARRFAQSGYNIQLGSRNMEELSAEADNLKVRYGVETRTFFFDALDFDSHSAFYANLNAKPSGVIVAFGVLGNQSDAQNDFRSAKAIIDTNYSGAVSNLEVIAADFEKRRWGFIVGISSVAGDRGRQSNYIYGSAKAGFSTYLSGLRHRLFTAGCTVLTVKPGFVATKMTSGLDLPEKLTASPQDVAEKIFSGVRKKKDTIYVKPIWRVIMWIIIHLPELVFKRTGL